jgi:uncharacterized protein
MSAKRKKRDGKPDPAVLATIIREVVEAAGPEKIVLFGSAARGTMGPNSDYDILVIKKGEFSHDRLAETIYRNLSGAAAVDVVVASTAEVARYRDAFCQVIYPALREGKVIYDSNGRGTSRAASGPPRYCQVPLWGKASRKPTSCARRQSRTELMKISSSHPASISSVTACSRILPSAKSRAR